MKVFNFILLMVLLLFLASVWLTAHAADVHTGKAMDEGKLIDYKLTLLKGACDDKSVLEYLHDNVLDDRRFTKGAILWDGKPFAACWIDINDEVYFIGSDKAPLRPVPRGNFAEEGV